MSAQAAIASEELHGLFSSMRAGEPIAFGPLRLVPLLLDAPAHGQDMDLLEEGLQRGTTQVTEVSEGGSVNTVRVTHSGVRMLLLVDGEQIIGAKQNRIVNASFLVPPGASVVVPVSCVEKGRWHYQARGFESSETTITASARAAKLKRVTTSLGTGRGYDADQGAVWRDVDDYLHKSQVVSTTSAFADAYRTRSGAVEADLAKLAVAPGQVGLAAVHGGKLVGLDVFATPGLYARGWKKVARGVLADVYAQDQAPADAKAVVERALRELAGSRASRQKAPGAGETLHGSVPSGVFSAVVHEGSVVHATMATA
jgi:hypothetical protein